MFSFLLCTSARLFSKMRQQSAGDDCESSEGHERCRRGRRWIGRGVTGNIGIADRRQEGRMYKMMCDKSHGEEDSHSKRGAGV